MKEITLNYNNFNSEVLQSDKPVLVDFWATWCGPCRMISPIISDIADQYDGTIKVGKVNVDDNQEIARQYGISSIPTLLVFKNGQVVNKSVGYMSKQQIEKLF